jgi:hypothetical protein
MQSSDRQRVRLSRLKMEQVLGDPESGDAEAAAAQAVLGEDLDVGSLAGETLQLLLHQLCVIMSDRQH